MVIGAGVAGLFAAAAASGAGCPVVVLERDHFDRPGPRPGVPQGTQAHVYLLRGLQAADELLPGLTADLRAAGAVPFDTGATAWRAELGWYPSGALRYEVLSMTRPLFESVLRRRALQAGGVELRTGIRVNGLSRGPGGQWRVDCAGAEPVTADLVVDASGRSSRLAVWLAALGLPAPAVEEVDARVGYATRLYHQGPDLGPLSGLVIQATPARPTGSAVLPVENGQHVVGVIGYGEHRPPRDEDGFLALIRGLTDPCIADFVAAAQPCGPVAIHRQTANRHHHFERLRSWPDGLLPIGDSFVSLNPTYGQGVAVAAGQAVVLRRALRATGGAPDTRSLVRRFGALVRWPWQVATGQDLRQPSCPGRLSRSAALADAWVLTVQKLAVHGNVRAFATLNGVYHLLTPPSVLVHPALLLAAGRARVFGYPRPVARPAALPGPAVLPRRPAGPPP